MQLAPLAVGGPSLNDGVGALPQPSAPATPTQALNSPSAVSSPLTALQAAVAEAAAGQGGLATLLADLAAALQSPVVPPAVQAAGAQVLSYQLPIDPPPTAADLRQAVAQSGLFLESQLANGGPAVDLKSALLNLGQALEAWSGTASTDPAPLAAATPAVQTYGAGPPQGPANLATLPATAISTPKSLTPPSPPFSPAAETGSTPILQTVSAALTPSDQPAPALSASAAPPVAETGSTPILQIASAALAPSDQPAPAVSAAPPPAEIGSTPLRTASAALASSDQPAPALSASAPAPASAPASAQVQIPGAPSPSPSPTPAILQAVVQAATVAPGGLTVLSSELAAALRSPALPPAVRAAINAVLTIAAPPDAPAPTAGLGQAAASNDMPPVLQRTLLQPTLLQPPLIQPGGEALAAGLKIALSTLSQALEAWSAPTDAATSAPTEAAASAPSPARAPPAAPPYRGGPLQGQAAPPLALPPDAFPEPIAAHLLKATGAALSRQVLMQAASSPTEAATNGKPPAPHWMFEIPLATPQGASVVPFEIEGDDALGGDAGEPTWRTRFSLDVHPMGPVHAKLTLRGGTVRVALWAEDADTQSLLSDQRSDLADTLHQAGLDARIAVLPGAPETAAPPPAGRFMDKAV